MAEGGMFPWKRQVIDEHRGPAASYKGIGGPLPPPPKNMIWTHDPETREWRLVEHRPNVAAVEAIVLDGDAPLDYTEHKIEPSDTFQGICLRYKITPTELRRANCFSGTNLSLARNPLRIPLNHAHTTGAPPTATAVLVNPYDVPMSRESQIQTVMQAAGIQRAEATCFLELHDWDVTQAVADARSDYHVPDDNDTFVNKATAAVPQVKGSV
ncbi:hypothetical protein MHU86_83 [Fragilaria crotonensis]|nr:hypothetical protein MHU86_83 [Fragilaria crotonensis]